jgi:pyruvate,water dikinase
MNFAAQEWQLRLGSPAPLRESASEAREPKPLIICCDAAQPEDLLGGKAGAFARLRQAQFPIPRWIVVTPEAFDESLTKEQRAALERAKDRAEILRALRDVRPGYRLQKELAAALAELCPNGERVAVRSSALEEDAAHHSFAGQYESFLFVPPGEVARKVVKVWRWGFTERVLAYCRERGVRFVPRAPAVLIQHMVNAERAGVAFSADPVSGKRSVAVVSACLGLGSALVSGQCDADCYRVDLDGKIIAREIANKLWAYSPDPESPQGVQPTPVAEREAEAPALDDAQIRAIAELARRAEAALGRPQDVEWAIKNGHIYLLQSRPITSLVELADPDGTLALWDNSNIVESYSGVTTPLTFSFARRAYEGVYRQFCSLMRVPSARTAENCAVFARMLGLFRGRIYYNLLNWYRVLALLPGYAFNREFMEQMMGVKDRLPEGVLPEAGRAPLRERAKDGLRVLHMLCAMTARLVTLPRRIEQFHGRVNHALKSGCPDLSRLRPDELVAYYRELERQLLTRWDAPLVNDFFAMIFYGALRKLTAQWCDDSEGTLQNNLLCGEGGMISAEPAAHVRAMAELARTQPHLADALCRASAEIAIQEMKSSPKLMACYQLYLEKFGDRCCDELKLESSTLHGDPLPLLRSIGQLASRMAGAAAHAGNGNCGQLAPRLQAEERVQEALAHHPLRRLIYLWVLKNARNRVRDRENLRFERTRVFGSVRRIFIELGLRFCALDRLDEPGDIFYLELDEILGFVEGTSTCTNLRGLAALRKTEFAEFSRLEPPAERFETRGIAYQGNSFQRDRAVQESNGEMRRAIGCCPGRVRGRVHVVRNPSEAAPQPGSILVAERTDPGWILLFPFAAGVLVERGSLLSHSAIVARELGIPTVVSIEGLTRWLKEGDWVELDGGTGVVTRLAQPQ